MLDLELWYLIDLRDWLGVDTRLDLELLFVSFMTPYLMGRVDGS